LPDAYVNEIGDASFDEWRKTGYSEVNGYEFAIFLDALRYNPYESAQQIKTPCLITHGDKDEIASLRQSKYLFECFKGEKRMEIFEGGSHGYSEEGAWDRMAKMFVDWFAERL
jgi:dipeptidyl aminopeptidase/acylaminoacyl peptidase